MNRVYMHIHIHIHIHVHIHTHIHIHTNTSGFPSRGFSGFPVNKTLEFFVSCFTWASSSNKLEDTANQVSLGTQRQVHRVPPNDGPEKWRSKTEGSLREKLRRTLAEVL